MSIPGFTAETSLWMTGTGYRSGGPHQLDGIAVEAATYIDQNCLAGCEKDCGAECAGTVGQARSACVKACANDNKDCGSLCIRPGSAPTSGVGATTAPDPCDAATAFGCSFPISHCATICAFDAILGTDWCSCVSTCLTHLAPPPLSVAGCFSCVQKAFRC